MRFVGYPTVQFSDAQPPATTFNVVVGPRTFFEMVMFSITVSVATQLIMRFLFKPRS